MKPRNTLFLLVFLLAVNSCQDQEWQQLFNGKDLTGWEQVGPGEFVVEDGLSGNVSSGFEVNGCFLNSSWAWFSISSWVCFCEFFLAGVIIYNGEYLDLLCDHRF